MIDFDWVYTRECFAFDLHQCLARVIAVRVRPVGLAKNNILTMNHMPSRTYQAAVDEIRRLYARGSNDLAKSLAAKLLTQQPEDIDIRDVMRRVVRTMDGFDREGFVEEVEEALARQHEFTVLRAAMGWQYATTLDRRYLSPDIERLKPSDQAKAKLAEIQTAMEMQGAPVEGALDDVFGRLRWFDDHQERYEFLEALAKADDPLLREDDFTQIPDPALNEAVRARFKPETLNVVIVGAGCAGLALANALKVGFGDHIHVLVIENRVETRHRKKPYNRVWLTHINMPLLRSFLAEEVVEALGQSGANDFMGASLDLYETILMLSCRQRGVDFLFDADPDYQFLEGSHVDLMFDATGGRLELPAGATEPAAEPDMIEPFAIAGEKNFGAGFAQFGITNHADQPNIPVSLTRDGERLVPLFEGKRIRYGMFKIIDVPMHWHQDLVKSVAPENDDSTFYFWPGHLVGELNKLLLLINLDADGYRALVEAIPGKMPLEALAEGGDEIAIEGLDARVNALLNNLLERIRAAGESIAPVHVEAPFLYDPYIIPPTAKNTRLYNVPVIPVGDSLFCGHPKVGNGLLSHLAHVRHIHDVMLELF